MRKINKETEMFGIIGKFSYPRLQTWLEFQPYDDDLYLIYNGLTEERYVATRRLIQFISQLDGATNPYSILTGFSVPEITECLQCMAKLGMLRKKRVVSPFPWFLMTLWIPNGSNGYRSAAKVFNMLLMLLFLPVLGFGIYSFLIFLPDNWSPSVLDTVAGVLISSILGSALHELSHAAACLSYGGSVYEYGLTVRIILPGAYVMMDTSRVKRRLQKFQIFGAGIESNLLLSGVCMILSVKLGSGMWIYLIGAIGNLLTAVFNILLIDGLDGMKMLTSLLGMSEEVIRKKLIASIKHFRKSHYWNLDPTVAFTGAILFGMQITLPVLLLLNILEVVQCFIP